MGTTNAIYTPGKVKLELQGEYDFKYQRRKDENGVYQYYVIGIQMVLPSGENRIAYIQQANEELPNKYVWDKNKEHPTLSPALELPRTEWKGSLINGVFIDAE